MHLYISFFQHVKVKLKTKPLEPFKGVENE